MPEKDIQIIATISSAIPKLTEEQKDRLLSFGEGVALMADRKEEEESRSE